MRVVRRGVTRTVILTRRYAIKLPSMRGGALGPRGFMWSITRGIQANLSEHEWSGTPGTCPVLWSFLGLINIYPRCKPVSGVLHEDIDFEAIGFLGPTDNKAENVGYLPDGRLVWIDYDMSWSDCLPCRRIGQSAAMPPA